MKYEDDDYEPSLEERLDFVVADLDNVAWYGQGRRLPLITLSTEVTLLLNSLHWSISKGELE